VTAYYNEFDPHAAAWLRELIAEGHIANGVVDTRSIEDVLPTDLAGFTQCHFFAGIGGWSLALRLADWPDDRPVWTGSCPCQPFSTAGQGAGFADERHLWPAFFHLVRQRRPDLVFGEQVANALPWLDLVQTDLEGEGYAVAKAIIGAHSVGAPHIRQRLYWVADNDRRRWSTRGQGSTALGHGETTTADRSPGELEHANNAGPQGRSERRHGTDQLTPWAPSLVDWIPCRDGKRRPVEAGTFPLAHGVPGRVGLLRGYGNAIVPQVAAKFIEAFDTLDIM
jgi:DNA (cytosine-5)-methyltransferase 1